MTEPTPETARPARAVSPINVFVFNLLVGACLGYFKLGQKKKGWTALVLFILLAVPTWCTGSLLLSLLTAVDGYLQAKQAENGRTLGEWTFFNAHR